VRRAAFSIVSAALISCNFLLLVMPHDAGCGAEPARQKQFGPNRRETGIVRRYDLRQ
jgi:hypothetical protein